MMLTHVSDGHMYTIYVPLYMYPTDMCILYVCRYICVRRTFVSDVCVVIYVSDGHVYPICVSLYMCPTY